MKEHKLSAKIDGKWFTFGNVKVNQFGNLQASLKVTPELISFLNSGKQWVNFAMFERDDKDKPATPAPVTSAPQDLDSDIPF